MSFIQLRNNYYFLSSWPKSHFLLGRPNDPFSETPISLTLSLCKKLEKLSHLLEKTHFLENPFSREGTVSGSM